MVVLTSTMADRGMLTLGFEDWCEHARKHSMRILINKTALWYFVSWLEEQFARMWQPFYIRAAFTAAVSRGSNYIYFQLWCIPFFSHFNFSPSCESSFGSSKLKWQGVSILVLTDSQRTLKKKVLLAKIKNISLAGAFSPIRLHRVTQKPSAHSVEW